MLFKVGYIKNKHNYVFSFQNQFEWENKVTHNIFRDEI